MYRTTWSLVLFTLSIICPILSWREGHENARKQYPTVWDCVFRSLILFLSPTNLFKRRNACEFRKNKLQSQSLSSIQHSNYLSIYLSLEKWFISLHFTRKIHTQKDETTNRQEFEDWTAEWGEKETKYQRVGKDYETHQSQSATWAKQSDRFNDLSDLNEKIYIFSYREEDLLNWIVICMGSSRFWQSALSQCEQRLNLWEMQATPRTSQWCDGWTKERERDSAS